MKNTDNTLKFNTLVTRVAENIINLYVSFPTELRYSRLKNILNGLIAQNEKLSDVSRAFTNWTKLNTAKNILFNLYLVATKVSTGKTGDDYYDRKSTFVISSKDIALSHRH